MAYTFTRTGAQIEAIHNTVDDPSSNAQFSNEIRTIAGEYRGLWPDTGGSANKGDTYQTQVIGTGTGQYFTALQNTTVDPVGDDVNWLEVISKEGIYKYTDVVFDNVADMVLKGSKEGALVRTASYFAFGDTGFADYLIKTTAQASSDGDVIDGYGNHQLNNGLVAILQIRNDTIFIAQYGAIGNDIADDTNAINAATAKLNDSVDGARLMFDAKRYQYTGVWRPLTSGNEKRIIGLGSSTVGSQITFNYVSGEEYSIRWDVAFSGLTLQGLKLKGQGIGVNNPNGNPQNGMTDINTASTSYGCNVIDVQFSDWSGNGSDIRRWFQQRWLSCYARDVAGYGFIISGDQAASWDQAGGAWFNNIGEYCLWFRSGSPNIVNVNIGPSNNGIKLGEGLSNPCRATMRNINFEWINENGTGILVTANSQILEGGWLLFYGDWDEGATSPNLKESYAQIVFERLNGRNVLYQVGTSFLPSNDKSGGWTNRIIVESTNGGSSDRLELEESRDSEVTFRNGPVRFVEGASRNSAIGIQSDKFLDRQVETKGLKNSGISDFDPQFWVRSVDGGTLNFNPFGGGALPSKTVYLVNPDDGQVVVDLPPPANWIGKVICIANITDGTNNFRLNTFGASLIDGVDGVTYPEPYASVQIMAVDSNNWVEIYRKV